METMCDYGENNRKSLLVRSPVGISGCWNACDSRKSGDLGHLLEAVGALGSTKKIEFYSAF